MEAKNQCDGCGTGEMPLHKVSLGRDFFGRVYDRLSRSLDVDPKWYCPSCSREKDFQRDYRAIKEEFEKLMEGKESPLFEAGVFKKAIERVKEIHDQINSSEYHPRFLPPSEVLETLRKMKDYFLVG